MASALGSSSNNSAAAVAAAAAAAAAGGGGGGAAPGAAAVLLSKATNGMTMDQLEARFVGTAQSADEGKHRWLEQQHRDTYASHIAHADQLAYLSVAQNQSIARTRLQMLDKMIRPCGPAPPTKDIDKIMEKQLQKLED